MIICKLPYNPIAYSMSYNNEVLTIEIRKKGNSIQYRSYRCDITTAYKLFYAKTAEQVISHFNENIKGKLTVIEVK